MEISNLRMHSFNTSLMGVVKGVLDYFGIKMSDGMAFAGSSHAFLINIHDQICPSAPYCWKVDDFARLLRNLGVELIDLGFFHGGSGPTERAEVEQAVRGHLDRSRPCSLCNMDNQIIYGHDDTKLLLAQPWTTCTELTPATLTYASWEELGRECHVNFFAFRKIERREDAAVIGDGMRHAVDLFRNPAKYSLPRYGIGLKAYENWVRGVSAGHGSSHGNWWNATVWSECRIMAAEFFDEVAETRGGEIAAQAEDLSEDYAGIAKLLAAAGSKEMPADEKIPLLRELAGREERAIEKVEALAGFFPETGASG